MECLINIADLLYPDCKTVSEIELLYPKRNLPDSAMVTRFAPSPTGFLHIGNLFGAVTDKFLAKQSGGVFYLRIEDTDSKREIPGGVKAIIDALSRYNVNFDEGATEDEIGRAHV